MADRAAGSQRYESATDASRRFGRPDGIGKHTGPKMRTGINGNPESVRPADAVAASCAIPVLARPVQIGRHRSSTEGALANQRRRARRPRPRPRHRAVADGAHVHRCVQVAIASTRAIAGQREVRALRNHGVEVQVISPDAATIKAMGWNMLERDNAGSVIREAFLGTLNQLRPDVVATLRGTRSARARLMQRLGAQSVSAWACRVRRRVGA